MAKSDLGVAIERAALCCALLCTAVLCCVLVCRVRARLRGLDGAKGKEKLRFQGREMSSNAVSGGLE